MQNDAHYCSLWVCKFPQLLMQLKSSWLTQSTLHGFFNTELCFCLFSFFASTFQVKTALYVGAKWSSKLHVENLQVSTTPYATEELLVDTKHTSWIFQHGVVFLYFFVFFLRFPSQNSTLQSDPQYCMLWLCTFSQPLMQLKSFLLTQNILHGFFNTDLCFCLSSCFAYTFQVKTGLYVDAKWSSILHVASLQLSTTHYATEEFLVAAKHVWWVSQHLELCFSFSSPFTSPCKEKQNTQVRNRKEWRKTSVTFAGRAFKCDLSRWKTTESARVRHHLRVGKRALAIRKLALPSTRGKGNGVEATEICTRTEMRGYFETVRSPNRFYWRALSVSHRCWTPGHTSEKWSKLGTWHKRASS